MMVDSCLVVICCGSGSGSGDGTCIYGFCVYKSIPERVLVLRVGNSFSIVYIVMIRNIVKK